MKKKITTLGISFLLLLSLHSKAQYQFVDIDIIDPPYGCIGGSVSWQVDNVPGQYEFSSVNISIMLLSGGPCTKEVFSSSSVSGSYTSLYPFSTYRIEITVFAPNGADWDDNYSETFHTNNISPSPDVTTSVTNCFVGNDGTFSYNFTSGINPFCSSLVLRWGEDGSFQNTQVIASSSSSSFTFTGLKPGYYMFYSDNLGYETFPMEGDGQCMGCCPGETKGCGGKSIAYFQIIDEGLTWTGAVSSEWSDAGNWSPNFVPTTLSNVTIPSGTLHSPFSEINGACKDFSLYPGATFVMTGGTLDIYGTFWVAIPQSIEFWNGTVILNRGHELPRNMTFHNLTFTEDFANPTPDFNTYELPGKTIIKGNLSLLAIDNDVLNVNMHYGDTLILRKNLSSINGRLGRPAFADAVNDVPYIAFAGSTQQNIKVDNQGNVVYAAIELVNTDVKLNSNLGIKGSLFLNAPFDIRGKKLAVTNKIIYKTPQAGISNSRPNHGRLIIIGAKEINSMLGHVTIRALSRIRYVELYVDTVQLETNLAVDTLKLIGGAIDLKGHNLTIGKLANARGYLDTYHENGNGNFAYPIFTTVNSGMLSLLGNAQCPEYNLTATNLFNFRLNNPKGATLHNPEILDQDLNPIEQEPLRINGTASLIKGAFNYNYANLYIDPAGKIRETPGNFFLNLYPDSSGILYSNYDMNSVSTNLNLGGTGFIVTTSNPLGFVEVNRRTKAESGINNNSGIYRTYSISAAGDDLNAEIKIKYDDQEVTITGIDEANLGIFTSADGEVWVPLQSTVNTTSNTVTASGAITNFLQFNRFTLGDRFKPLREEQINNDAEAIISAGGLVLYPNPVNNKITVMFNAGEKSNCILKITDVTGRLISQQKGISVNGENEIHIDIKHYGSGIYFVTLISDTEEPRTIKFVKQ